MDILVRLNHLYHLASLGPVAGEFEKRGHRLFFSCEKESKRAFGIPLSKRNAAERQLRKMGHKTTREKSGFDLVLTGDIPHDPEKYRGARLVFVNHGTGFKSVVYRLLRDWPDVEYHIMVEGPYRKERIEATGAVGSSSVHIVGYPKLDPLFRGEIDGEAIFEKYGLKRGIPTVLFAPSHRPSCIDTIADSICEATVGMNLLIKLHPFSWGGKYAPHKHHRLFERAVSEHEHARLVAPADNNILPFVAASDIIVSGVSSTIFEMLAAGKFGVIVDMPRSRRGELDESPRELFGDAWPVSKDKTDLREAIEEALNPSPEMRNAASKLQNYLFYGLDGKASTRVADISEGLFNP